MDSAFLSFCGIEFKLILGKFFLVKTSIGSDFFDWVSQMTQIQINSSTSLIGRSIYCNDSEFSTRGVRNLGFFFEKVVNVSLDLLPVVLDVKIPRDHKDFGLSQIGTIFSVERNLCQLDDVFSFVFLRQSDISSFQNNYVYVLKPIKASKPEVKAFIFSRSFNSKHLYV